MFLLLLILGISTQYWFEKDEIYPVTQTSNIHVSVAARYQKISAKSWYAKLQNINQTRQANLCFSWAVFFRHILRDKLDPNVKECSRRDPATLVKIMSRKIGLKHSAELLFPFFLGFSLLCGSSFGFQPSPVLILSQDF